MKLGGNVITLDPLHAGPDALNPAGIRWITKVTLLQLQFVWENDFHEISTREADSIFDCAAAEETAGAGQDPIPLGAAPLHALFEFQFTYSPEPHTVEVCPPDILKLQHPSDTFTVCCWLSKTGFIIPRAQP
jgi:hypothetical protein